ncbi:F0F1 ATP synthase subunit gamma [Aquipuribacter sp. MA13-6]|uniref:F0F1 ATP synthase subunit gamma n=1 Tax=unclassified Aquipuribacter TaxID=2635084 RepID=UPI003EEDC424
MAASLRVYRERIRAVTSTKKITRAMELIAASRIVKAQQRSREAAPYARAITRAVSALASFSDVDHPLTTERAEVKRAAMLLITSDRGLAGSYSSSVIKEGDRLAERLREADKEVVPYLLGRKGVAFYGFRSRHVERSWTGDSDAPKFETAAEVGQTLVDAFLAGSENGGVDEINIVFTRFVNMVKQEPTVIRLLPVEVVDEVAEAQEGSGGGELLPLYDFEPDADAVLDALMPQYIQSRIYSAMLSASASELAARQQAMKSATDNATDLIRRLQQQANAARQAAITQEISEIVGGADALASSGSES